MNVFQQIVEVSAVISLNTFVLLSFTFTGTNGMFILVSLKVSHISLRLCSLLSFYFLFVLQIALIMDLS